MTDARQRMELDRATDHRATCDLRYDVRRLLLACLSATETAKRWQLVAIAPSLAMLRHVLSEKPHEKV